VEGGKGRGIICCEKSQFGGFDIDFSPDIFQVKNRMYTISAYPFSHGMRAGGGGGGGSGGGGHGGWWLFTGLA
jgi:hypothetical protein